MRKFISASFIAILCNTAIQAQFVVKDVLAVSPQASIFDPEYNTKLNIVCWKSDDNNLWISGLNPVTHMYEPADGKGTFITGNLSPNGDGSWNGPEWMLSTQLTQVVYNQTIGGIRYPGVATQVPGGWQNTTLFQYPGAAYSMATANYADSTSRFLIETTGISGISWVRNTDLNTSYFHPGVTLGFFARDNQQICCATSQAKHPGFIEVSTSFPYFTFISQDTIGAPYMWNDPETNSRLFMYRTNWNRTMKVYQEITPGQWILYNQFDSPLPPPFKFITSPEPFTCGGHSYISFMAAQSGSAKDGLPAQIWIAGANPGDAFLRCVSDTSVAIRVDPEPVVFSDSAFVYYTYVPTDKKTTNQYLVRKCNTGLGNLYTGNEVYKTASPVLSVFPNPCSGIANLRSPSIFGSGTSIEIYDLTGRKVLNTNATSSTSVLDLSPLPDGKYLIKIRKQGKEASTTVSMLR